MKFVEIKLVKHTVYLTHAEIVSLLSPSELATLPERNTELWTLGIKRGKAFKRSSSLNTRMQQKPYRERR